MDISIFGLGYVGAVSCACFAREGHKVIGVDISSSKVDLINSGTSPIIEKDLEKYIKQGVKKELIKASINLEPAILESELSIICVGTPSEANGNLNLQYVHQVCSDIAKIIKNKKTFHSIVIRSTVIPGTIQQCIRIIEEISGKIHKKDFGVASNPEFLREGTAIYDFLNPPYTMFGTLSEKTEMALRELYKNINAPIFCLKPEESEMIKYTNNNFHAMKITFANEIGNICKELGVDSHVVMDIVCQDKKLNLSPYYLKPGFAFGGSCLPKDVRGMNYTATKLNLKTPLLSSLIDSNKYQIERGLDLIYKTNKKKIGFLGFAFKAGTDDLRESPIVELIETLIGKGFDLSLFDNNVLMSKLLGKNKEYINNHIPHISLLLKEEISDVFNHADVIVIGNKSFDKELINGFLKPSQIVIDLVRIDDKKESGENYEGICW